MGDENRELQFTIKTVGELAGAEAVARSLEMQIGKAKALKQPYGELQDQLDRVNTSFTGLSPKLAELHDAEEKAGHGAEFLHENHSALHKLFNTLGRESVPELGHAMGAMLMGPVGPAIALTAIFGVVKKSIEDWNEEMDRLAESNAQASFAAGIDAVKTSSDAAAKSLGDYEAQLAKIATHETTIAQALASQLGFMRAIAAERDKERKAADELNKSKTERQQAAGQITPEQAVLKETADAIAAAKAEAAAKKKNEDDQNAAEQAALNEARQKQVQLDADATAKNVQLETEKKHRERLVDFNPKDGAVASKEKVDKAKKDRDDLQELIENSADFKSYEFFKKKLEENPNDRQAQANFDAAKSGLNAPHFLESGFGYGKSLADKMAELETANANLQNLLHGQRQFNAVDTPEAKAALNQMERDKTTAQEKSIENQKFIDDHSRALEDRKKSQAASQPIADKELADRIGTILEQAVTKLYTMPHGAEVKTGIQVADEVEKAVKAAALARQYQQSRTLSTEDAQFLMKFANEHGANAGTADQSSAFVVKNFGNVTQHETTDITQQNIGQFSDAERYLVLLANNLGAHVKNVKDAADFVEKMKDNTQLFFDRVISMSNSGFTAQQHQLDALAVTLSQIKAKAELH